MLSAERIRNLGLYGSLCGFVFFLGISKAISEVFLIAAFVLSVLFFIKEKKNWKMPGIYTVSAAGFIAAGLIPLLYSKLPADQTVTALRGGLKWLESFGIFAVFFLWTRDDQKKTSLILLSFMAGMFLVTASGYYQLLTGHDFLRGVTLDPGRIIRMKSSLGAPNTLSTFYCFAIPVSFYWAFNSFEKIRFRAFGFAGLLLFVPAWILTFSRAGFFALIFAAMIILFCFRLNRRIIILISSLIAAVFFIPALRGNFISSLNWQDITIGERMKYWEYAIRMIGAHPFFGWGLNLFYIKLPLFMPPSETYRGYAHNCYLQMTAEAGLAGLLFFTVPHLTFFTSSIMRMRAKIALDRLLLCLSTGWLAVLMFAFFDNQFYSIQPAHLFWAFWGMLAARKDQLPCR